MQLNLNLGDFYAILTALCWSCGVIFFEIAGRVLNSLQISLLKNIVGVLGFISFIILQGDPFPDFIGQEYLILVISGIIGVAIGDIFFLASLRRIGSSLSAIVSTGYTISIFILAFLMFGEVISFISYLGGVLVILGVVIGTIDRDLERTPKEILYGVSFGLLANLCTAYSVLLLRPIMDVHPVVPIALIRFSIGMIISAFGILYLNGKLALRETILKGFSNYNLLAGAFFGTFLSVIFWLAGFKYTLAGRAAIYNQLSTIFIILLASVFLNQHMTKRKWVAVSLALMGSFVVSLY
jgi:drug/metabolite transporter (DMT)-like permease